MAESPIAKNIQAIDKASTHRLCSGQVILNLSLAIKELIENSLDAGATSIEIRTKDYGSELIEIIDNGCGVEEKNFKALTLKHHTSKLKDFNDISSIETFGFRGEALSSLCALSNLTITTCHKDDAVGTRLEYNHEGVLIKQCPVPRQVGTTICLQNLFAPLPVRHKEFINNIRREYNKMIQLVTSYCIVCTNTRMICINQLTNGKKTTLLTTTGCPTTKENIACIFTPKQLSSLVEFQGEPPSSETLEEYSIPSSAIEKTDMFRIEGFVSSSQHGQGRSSSDRQYFYINGRPCDLYKVSRLMNEVYHSYNRQQYPFIFLNIIAIKESVDVNVTPDKRQIFVQNEKLLLAIIKTSLLKIYESEQSKLGSIQNIKDQKNGSFTDFFKILKDPDSNKNNSVFGRMKRSLSTFFYSQDKHELINKRQKITPKVKRSISFSPKLEELFKKERMEDNELDFTNELLNSSNGKKIPEKDKILYTEDKADKLLESNIKTNLISKENLNDGAPQSHLNENDVNNSSKLGESICIFNEKLVFKDRNDEENKELKSINSDEFINNENTEIKYTEIKSKTDSLKNKISKHIDSIDIHMEETDKLTVMNKKSLTLQFSMEKLKNSVLHKSSVMQKNEERFRRFKAKIMTSDNTNAEAELKKEISKDMFAEMKVIGQFNKGFIVAMLGSDLFIIDQHATDEKYNYEIMQQNSILETQKLLHPQCLNLTAVNESILLENLEIFRKNGFDFNIDNDATVGKKTSLISVPVINNWSLGKEDIEEMIFLLNDSPGKMCRPSRIYQMLASRACRKSVMIGTALSRHDMRKLINHMGEIEHPWNCPHGRPTIRHLFNMALLDDDCT